MAAEGEVSVTFTSREEAALWASFSKLDENQRRAAISAGRAGGEMLKAEQALKRFADRTRSIDATPLDRLRASTRQLDEAVKANLLTEEQAARARKRFQDEYQRELGETKAAAEDAAHESGSAWSGAVTIASTAASTIAASVMALFRSTRAEAEALQQFTRESAGGLGRLAQIAPDAKAYADLTGKARELFAKGSAPSVDAAADVIFDAANAGAMGELETLAALKRSRVVENVGEFAKSAASLRFTMGEQETGGFGEIFAKAFVAAAPSTTSPDKLLTAAAKAGAPAKVLGLSDEEVLSATSILATAKGTSEEGGTRLASLLRALGKQEDLAGLSLAEQVKNVEGRGLSVEGLSKLLGSEEAIEALHILNGKLTQLVDLTAQTKREARPEVVAERIALAESDPTVAAEARRRARTNAAQLAGEAEGNLASVVDSVIEERVGAIRSGKIKGAISTIFGDGSVTRSLDVAGVRAGAALWRNVPGMDKRLAEMRAEATPDKAEAAALRGAVRAAEPVETRRPAEARRREERRIAPLRRPEKPEAARESIDEKPAALQRAESEAAAAGGRVERPARESAREVVERAGRDGAALAVAREGRESARELGNAAEQLKAAAAALSGGAVPPAPVAPANGRQDWIGAARRDQVQAVEAE